MFSLERQRARSDRATVFFPFMVRRCFRIYPLAILVVTFRLTCSESLRICNSEGFDLLHQKFRQSHGEPAANSKCDPAEGESRSTLEPCPLEIQMYLCFVPALFSFLRPRLEIVVGA